MDRSCRFPENAEEKIADEGPDEGPVVVTTEGLLRDLQRIQRNAEASDSHPSAIRAVELRARIGLVVDKDRQSYEDDDVGPSPADLLRPPDMRYPDDAS